MKLILLKTLYQHSSNSAACVSVCECVCEEQVRARIGVQHQGSVAASLAPPLPVCYFSTEWQRVHFNPTSAPLPAPPPDSTPVTWRLWRKTYLTLTAGANHIFFVLFFLLLFFYFFCILIGFVWIHSKGVKRILFSFFFNVMIPQNLNCYLKQYNFFFCWS